ncbi:MAG TPA: methylenetetrahydrofolate reductase [Xanthobacteraceae bacterium]|jgi:methylenetetrahydrofolate reductase (NADPH)
MSIVTPSPVSPFADRPDPVDAIVDFVRGFSLEATRPSAEDIAVLAAVARPGTRVYVSALPTRPVQDAIEEVASWRAAGFEPVPHLAVRNFATARELDDFLARVGEAGVRRVLVIAGDRDQPSGDFRSSIEVIDGGALQRHGIVEIGIAGYPDGHPRISEQDLERSLAEKIHVAETTGMAVHIVTQFCFDAPTVLKWIGRLRDFGVEHPVRVGLPGPTNLATLLRYARRCGVRASAQGLARQAGLVRQLFAMSTPDVLVRAIAEARAHKHLGEIAPHFFSFGGLAQAARWAAAVAEHRIALEPSAGFRVEPPRPKA